MRLLLILVALATPVFADDEPEPAHEGVALALSLGGTLASYGMLAAAVHYDNPTLGTAGFVGTLIAPSAGHWYADDYFSHGFKARLVGLATAGVGVLSIVSSCVGEEADCGPSGGALVLLGAGIYAYGTMHDIVTAPRAARRHNVIVAPTANGFVVAGSF